jgi:hypothetical protein
MSRIFLFRPLRLLTIATALVALCGVSFVAPLAANAESSTTYTLTVHYYRFDNTYTNWNLWTWVNTQTGATPDCTVTSPTVADGAQGFTGSDAFGMYGTITYTCPTSVMNTAGLIVRQTGWANREPSNSISSPGNRILTFPAGVTSLSDWVVSHDPNDYSSLASANLAKFYYLSTAKFSGKHVIDTTLTRALGLTAGGAGWTLKDLKTKKTYKASRSADGHQYPGLDAVAVGDFQSQDGNPNDSGGWNPASTTTKMKQINGDLYEYSITLPAGSYNYKVAIGGAWTCGTCGQFPGNNVSLELDGKEQVTFYFIPYGDQVYDSVNNPIVALPLTGVGFATTAVNVTFPKVTLNTKHNYLLTGPGVPATTIKKGSYTRTP